MAEYEPIELKAYYRASTHLPIWEVIDKAGIWRQVGVESVSMQYCLHPSDAETALFDGSVDFVSGNHITPYALIAQGKPIVCLTSPSNGVRSKLVTREKISAVNQLRGMRIVDRALEGRLSGFSHPRGNHMLYVQDAGLDLDDDVTWIEIGTDPSPEVRAATFDALKNGDADATFAGGNTEAYEEAGFHVLQLDLLPMINGPTLTTTYPALQRKDRLGERLVKAVVMGIHYAKAHREETELILRGLMERMPELGKVRYESVARIPAKPYPELAAVRNAHRLCLMKADDASKISPLALWDIHYLRELDQSGFIDDLYAREPAQ